MSLQSSLKAALAGLASGGAWNQRAPQNTVPPYIVWGRVTSVTNNAMEGASTLQNTRVQIDVYATSYATADATAAAIEAAISASGLTSVKLSEQDFYEDDTKLYRVSQDFSIWAL